MNARNRLIWIAGAALLAAGVAAQQPAPQAMQTQERNAHRTQVNAAKTEQERIRSEHREMAQRRGTVQGVDVRGIAFGPGPGAGPGKGGNRGAGRGK
jgi:Flp pilus assembly protein TadB